MLVKNVVFIVSHHWIILLYGCETIPFGLYNTPSSFDSSRSKFTRTQGKLRQLLLVKISWILSGSEYSTTTMRVCVGLVYSTSYYHISYNLQFLSSCRLLAPYISSGIFWEMLKLWMKGFKVIVLDVPLLFEAKMDKWTKPIIVIWVDPETQLQRLVLRDRTSEDVAQNRINAQMSLDLKRTRADIVIDNTGSLEDLKEQFQNVLFEVTKPLTWTEFWLSRQGAASVLVSIIVGVLIFRKVYNTESL